MGLFRPTGIDDLILSPVDGVNSQIQGYLGRELVIPPGSIDANDMIATGNLTSRKKGEIAPLAVTNNRDGQIIIQALDEVSQQTGGNGVVDKKASGCPIIKIPSKRFDELLFIFLSIQGKSSGQREGSVGSDDLSIFRQKRCNAMEDFFASLGVTVEKKVASGRTRWTMCRIVHIHQGGDAHSQVFNGN